MKELIASSKILQRLVRHDLFNTLRLQDFLKVSPWFEILLKKLANK